MQRARSRSVTGLAYIDLFMMGIKPVVPRVVAFLDVGAMAFRTAGIPIEESTRPMQRVTGCDGLVEIGWIPPLPAFALGPGIPGNRKCPQPAVAKRQQILLQGLNPKRILDRIRFQLASGVIDSMKKASFWLKVVVTPKIIKVALLKSPRTVSGVASCIARS